MPTRKLAKADWKEYLEQTSHGLRGKQVEIEVAGLGLGDQLASDWVTLTGMSYDGRGDALEITTPSLTHVVPHPKDIYLDDGADGLHSMEIIDQDGHRHIVQFRGPLAIAPPQP